MALEGSSAPGGISGRRANLGDRVAHCRAAGPGFGPTSERRKATMPKNVQSRPIAAKREDTAAKSWPPVGGIVSPRRLAEDTDIPERTWERWRLTGKGPPFLRLGRRVAYRVSDVEAWLQARCYASRAAELARGE